MIIYITATIVSVLFGIAAVQEREFLAISKRVALWSTIGTSRIRYPILAICSFLPFFFVAAFRYEVGTDWFIYKGMFEGIETASANEFFYNLFNQAVYFITPHFSVMVAITSFIACMLVFCAIYRMSINVPLSIILFTISGTFFSMNNQVRQGIAIAIFLFAMSYIRDSKPLKYYLCILIACLFHTSALVYIIIYPLFKIKNQLRLRVLILIVGIGLFLPVNWIISAILTRTQYAWYFESVFSEVLGFDQPNFLFSGAMFVIYLYYYLTGDRSDKTFNLITNMILIGFVLLLYTQTIPQILRISHAFSVTWIIGNAFLIDREKNRNRRILLYLIIIGLYASKVLFDVYVNLWFDAVPYKSILMPDIEIR